MGSAGHTSQALCSERWEWLWWRSVSGSDCPATWGLWQLHWNIQTLCSKQKSGRSWSFTHTDGEPLLKPWDLSTKYMPACVYMYKYVCNIHKYVCFFIVNNTCTTLSQDHQGSASSLTCDQTYWIPLPVFFSDIQSMVRDSHEHGPLCLHAIKPCKHIQATRLMPWTPRTGLTPVGKFIKLMGEREYESYLIILITEKWKKLIGWRLLAHIAQSSSLLASKAEGFS